LRLRARGHHGIRRIVEIELRADLLGDQRLLALDVALLQVDRLLRQIEHLAVDFHIGDEIVVGRFGLFELRPGLVDRKLEGNGIDLEQYVVLVDVLAFLHHDLVDFSGDVGGDQNLLRADIGIVGAHVAAAIEIEHEPADRGRKRQHDQEKKAAIAPQSRHQAAPRFCGELDARLRRRDALLLGREFQDWISHNAAPSWALRSRRSEWPCARFP